MINPHFTYVLRHADDNLVMAQRLSEWSSRAHDLETDIGLTNMALDHLGQARALLTHAGELEGAGRSEDDLAFHRLERDFTNLLLVEQPIGDFATTIVRQLFFSTYQLGLWTALTESTDPVLAGVAAKALKEVRYHHEHATTWTPRLGEGTVESRGRMIAAIARLWPYTDELFETDDVDRVAVEEGWGVDPSGLAPAWRHRIDAVFAEASLTPPDDPYQRSGGRQGMHSTSFGYLLAEMQHLPRSMPEAVW